MSIADKRRRAQIKSVQSRLGRNAQQEPARDADDAATDLGASVLISDPDRTVAARLAEYLEIVGPPKDWPDARTLEQVRGEIIKTSHNALDLQAARGRLVERGELDKMASKIRDSWWREAQQIAPAALADLADLSIETRAKVKTAIEAQVAAAASRVKAEMVP